MGLGASAMVWPIDVGLLSMTKQRQSLYHVGWQVKRINYKGRWNSADLTDKIIPELKVYVNVAEHNERATKTYRVLNCLDAVYMGWKDKDKPTKMLIEFLKYKEALSNTYHDIILDAAVTWQVDAPEKIALDWIRTPPSIKKVLLKDLFKRFFGSTMRWEKGSAHERLMHTLKTRPELYWFLNIVAPLELSEALSDYRR